jgi:uncharacterized membrane protein
VTPSAIVGPLFQALATHGAFWSALNTACNMATYAVPVLCGALAAGQFNFTMIGAGQRCPGNPAWFRSGQLLG